MAHFANDGAFFTMPLVIAIMTSEHIIPSLTIIMIPVAYYGGSLVLSMAVAALADRAERPGLIVGLGLAVISVGLFGLAVSLSYVTGPALSAAVLFASFVTGLGTGFYHPIGAAILQLVYGDKNKGKALGVNGAMGAVGRAIYPTIFFTIAAAFTDNASIASVAAIGVAAAVVVSAGMRRTYLSASRSAGIEDTLGPGSLRSRITKPLIILAVVAFVTSFANNGIASWMPTYLALQKGLGISSSLGFTLTLMYAAAIFGQPLIGYLVDRFEKRLVLAMSTVGSSLSIIGYLFASGSLDVVLLVILGFFTFSTFPIFLSLASDYVPRKSSSLSNALVWSLGANGGSIIGPLVVGAVTLSGIASWSVAFELMAAAALVATSMIVLLRKPPDT